MIAVSKNQNNDAVSISPGNDKRDIDRNPALLPLPWLLYRLDDSEIEDDDKDAK